MPIGKQEIPSRISGPANNLIIGLLLVISLGTYVAGLSVHVTRDASKYAAIARGVYETGDYINLKINGEPYNQKPPLLFWLSALSFFLFGVSDFAFKLPVFLFSLAGIWFTFRLGKILFNRDVGVLAALLLGTSQIYYLYNMDIHTDTLLQTFVTFSLWQLYGFLITGKNHHLFLGFFGIGLAMLTKGPVGAVVPAFAVTGYLLFTRQYKRFADWRWVAGILLVIILILPALAGLYNQFGWEGIRFYFWDNNFGRMSGSSVSKNTNVLYYLVNLLVLFLPWMLILAVSLFLQLKSVAGKRMKGPEAYLFSGIWFFLAILSFSHGKLPNYLFPLMPLFAVLTARYVYLALSGKCRRLYQLFLGLQHGVAALTGMVVLTLSGWLYPVREPGSILVLGILFLAGLWPFFRKETPAGKLLMPSLAMIIALNFLINVRVAPGIFSDQASVRAAGIFNREAAPGEVLGNYNYPSHELFFYGKTPVFQVVNDVELVERMKKPGNWVFTTGEVVNRIAGEPMPKPDIIPLKHVWINKLSFSYLNPRTREAARDTLYLLRSRRP